MNRIEGRLSWGRKNHEVHKQDEFVSADIFFWPDLVNHVNPVQNDPCHPPLASCRPAFFGNSIQQMTLHPLRVEIIGRELALVWSDGKESYIPLEKLRRHCPCASCGGEPDVMGNIQRPLVSYGPQSFEMRSIHFVGGYALQPTWNDGHNTGLYSFRQLRALGPGDDGTTYARDACP